MLGINLQGKGKSTETVQDGAVLMPVHFIWTELPTMRAELTRGLKFFPPTPFLVVA